MFRRMITGWMIAVMLAVPAHEALAQDADDEHRRLRRTPVVEVFEASRDSVVNISSTSIVEVRSWPGLDGPLDRFFDLHVSPRRRVRQTSVGSGFILHEAGYVITNAHVVARTAERRVIFSDGAEYEAELIALDPASDLAVLKIQADRPLKALPFGRSDDLMVGETVIAIGNPFGYQHTVTSGVVSALERSIEINEQISFDGLIQTDASINPGNSGGPLLNVLGELIGVNTAIRGDAQNIGFAIPVDQLREKLPDLLSIERRYRVEVGLGLRPIGEAAVTHIAPESPAAEAGLRIGDVIATIGDRPVRGAVDVHIGILGYKPGDSIELGVRRDGEAIRASMVLRERPLPDGGRLAVQRLGVEIEWLDAQQLERVGLRGRGALRVTRVERGSPADRADMRPGDFLVNVNDQFPATTDDLGELLEPVRTGDPVRVGFLRVQGVNRSQWTVTVRAR